MCQKKKKIDCMIVWQLQLQPDWTPINKKHLLCRLSWLPLVLDYFDDGHLDFARLGIPSTRHANPLRDLRNTKENNRFFYQQPLPRKEGEECAKEKWKKEGKKAWGEIGIRREREIFFLFAFSFSFCLDSGASQPTPNPLTLFSAKEKIKRWKERRRRRRGQT